MSNKQIISLLADFGLIIGPKVRQDGMVLPLFIDAVALIYQPRTFNLVISALGQDINNNEIDVVVGGATAGIPLATGVALKLNSRLAWVRKEPKSYSQGRAVDGEIKTGDRVVLVDDFFVNGEAKEIFINHIQSLDAKVVQISTIGLISKKLLLDWQNKFLDIKVKYLASHNEVIAYLFKQGKINNFLYDVEKKFIADPYHWHEDKELYNEFITYVKKSKS